MKNKSIIKISVLMVILLLATNVSAEKQQQGSDDSNSSNMQVQQQQVQTSNQVQNQGEDKQIKTQEQEQMQERENMQNENEIDTEEHQNSVSNSIKKIEDVADRTAGVGQQIKTIAEEQNQSLGKTTQAMEKVQTRNKIQTFLFGTDYKNLGTLRSEIVQTQNRLEQLNKLMENVQNQGAKTELQNQIQTLEQEQTKIENFIKAEDGKFSLLGWFVKLFNK